MATPGELIKVVGETCGIAEVTVSTHYKILREAGLTSKGGRGLSAARMQSSDVANLLIALIASRQAKDAPEVVRYFRSFPRRRGHVNYDMPIIGESFGEWLENLCEACGSGTINPILESIPYKVFRHKWAIPMTVDDNPDETGLFIEIERELGRIEVFAERNNRAIYAARFWPDDNHPEQNPAVTNRATLWGDGIESICKALRGDDN